MRIIVVYDDTVKKSEVISDIIGSKGFSEVVVKKQKFAIVAVDDIVNGVVAPHAGHK